MCEQAHQLCLTNCYSDVLYEVAIDEGEQRAIKYGIMTFDDHDDFKSIIRMLQFLSGGKGLVISAQHHLQRRVIAPSAGEDGRAGELSSAVFGSIRVLRAFHVLGQADKDRELLDAIRKQAGRLSTQLN